MRLLLDSNVLISATIANGHCTELLEHCVRRHELITCRFILQEVFEKLSGKLSYPIVLARSAVRVLEEKMTILDPIEVAKSTCRDPKDTVILGAALAGQCGCVVTGDGDLLSLGQFRRIDIVSPRDFWRYEDSHGD